MRDPRFRTVSEMREHYRNPELQAQAFKESLRICVEEGGGGPFDRWDVWAKMNRTIPAQYLPKSLRAADIHTALLPLIEAGRVRVIGDGKRESTHWQVAS